MSEQPSQPAAKYPFLIVFIICQVLTIPPLLYLGYWTVVRLYDLKDLFPMYLSVILHLLTEGITLLIIPGLLYTSYPLVLASIYLLLLAFVDCSYKNFKKHNLQWIVWQVLIMGLLLIGCGFNYLIDPPCVD